MGAKHLARRAGTVAATLAVAGVGSPVVAQVALDGTTGPRGTLAGPDYRIGAELGRRAGGNLFHSFERFSLGTGESATGTVSYSAQTRPAVERRSSRSRRSSGGDLRPSLGGRGSGSSMVGSGAVIAAKVEEVIDLVVDGQEALNMAG